MRFTTPWIKESLRELVNGGERSTEKMRPDRLDFAVTLVGAVAAPFTGGVSLQVAAGAKAALGAVKAAIKPGAWSDLSSGVATISGIAGDLDNAFPGMAKRLSEQVGALGDKFAMRDLLGKLKEQGPLANVAKALVESHVVKFDGGKVKFDANAFEKLSLPAELAVPLAKLTEAGAAIRSGSFDVLQDASRVVDMTADELATRFEASVLKEGLSGAPAKQVEAAISDIKQAAPAQLAALRNLLGTPVVVAQVPHGEMVVLRRKAEAFFDDASNAFNDVLTQEAEAALEDVAQKLDARRKAWMDRRDAVAQDPAALDQLAKEVQGACGESGAALADLRKLKKELTAAQLALATRKRELDIALATESAASLAKQAAELREDVGNRKVAREKMRRTAGEAQVAVLADLHRVEQDRLLFAGGMTRLAQYDFEKAIADFRAALTASGIAITDEDVAKIANTWIRTGGSAQADIVARHKACLATAKKLVRRNPGDGRDAAARRTIVTDALAGMARWLLLLDGFIPEGGKSDRDVSALLEKIQILDIGKLDEVLLKEDLRLLWEQLTQLHAFWMLQHRLSAAAQLGLRPLTSETATFLTVRTAPSRKA